MSTEELDTILGRAMREKREYDRELTGLNIELRRIADHIRSVADALSRRCDSAEKITDKSLSPLPISMDAERYVDMETLNGLLANQERVYAKRNDADAAIAKLTP